MYVCMYVCMYVLSVPFQGASYLGAPAISGCIAGHDPHVHGKWSQAAPGGCTARPQIIFRDSLHPSTTQGTGTQGKTRGRDPGVRPTPSPKEKEGNSSRFGNRDEEEHAARFGIRDSEAPLNSGLTDAANSGITDTASVGAAPDGTVQLQSGTSWTDILPSPAWSRNSRRKRTKILNTFKSNDFTVPLGHETEKSTASAVAFARDHYPTMRLCWVVTRFLLAFAQEVTTRFLLTI